MAIAINFHLEVFESSSSSFNPLQFFIIRRYFFSNLNFLSSCITGNGYITTGVLKEILRELDDSLTNDDLDAMIEGKMLCSVDDLNLFLILFL